MDEVRGSIPLVSTSSLDRETKTPRVIAAFFVRTGHRLPDQALRITGAALYRPSSTSDESAFIQSSSTPA